MKLYVAPVAPNPNRVRTYVLEKGLEIELVNVSLMDGEHRSEQHLERNPAGTLPVLELDDGSFITESLSIIQYLEETFPEPTMTGLSTVDKIRAFELERKIEFGVFFRIVRLVHATNSPLGLPNNSGIAESENLNLPRGLERADALLKDNEFLMGDAPTIADCTLFAGLFFGEFFSWNVPEQYVNLIRWYESFKQRPSAQL
jgi:glutathione S-transferase